MGIGGITLAEIGRKIYYEKANGVVIWDKGEMSGDVQETTLEQDMQAMPVLTLIPADQLGVLQLDFGAYSEQFRTAKGYKVNPATGELQFVQGD